MIPKPLCTLLDLVDFAAKLLPLSLSIPFVVFHVPCFLSLQGSINRVISIPASFILARPAVCLPLSHVASYILHPCYTASFKSTFTCCCSHTTSGSCPSDFRLVFWVSDQRHISQPQCEHLPGSPLISSNNPATPPSTPAIISLAILFTYKLNIKEDMAQHLRNPAAKRSTHRSFSIHDTPCWPHTHKKNL